MQRKRHAVQIRESRARKKLLFRESQSSSDSLLAPPTLSPPLSNETSTVSNNEGSLGMFDSPSFDGLYQIHFSGQPVIFLEEDVFVPNTVNKCLDDIGAGMYERTCFGFYFSCK